MDSEYLPRIFKAEVLLLLRFIESSSYYREFSSFSRILLQSVKHYFGRPTSRSKYDRYSAADKLFSAYLKADSRWGIASSAFIPKHFISRARDFYSFSLIFSFWGEMFFDGLGDLEASETWALFWFEADFCFFFLISGDWHSSIDLPLSIGLATGTIIVLLTTYSVYSNIFR